MAFDLHLFPYLSQQRLIEKMPIVTLVRMRKTCSEIDSLISNHSNVLSGRTKMGLNATILAEKRDLQISIESPTSNCKKIVRIMPGFEQKLEGVAIKRLHVDLSMAWVPPENLMKQVPAVLDTWKPKCQNFSMENVIEFALLQHFIKSVWVTKLFEFRLEKGEFERSATNLLEIPFPGEVEMQVWEPYDGNDLFSKIRTLHRVIMTPMRDTIFIDFLLEIKNTSDRFNLKYFSTSIANTMPHLHYPYVSCAFPNYSPIWQNEYRTEHTALAYLNKNQAIIMEERRETPSVGVIIRIVPRSPPALLDYMENTLELKELMTSEDRNNFLKGDDGERLVIIRLAFLRAYDDSLLAPTARKRRRI